MKRCVNIDWLECYCIEDSINFPHDAEYFRKAGFSVKEREYGTPMYREMFTLYDHYDEPFVEIRRNPKSSNLDAGIFSPYAAHVRLSNRACYATEAARLMAEFLEQHGFWFQRISRIDLCYDFEYFDYGDDPKKFLDRFMRGRYSKINQANISAHGLDQWDGRLWNSVSWGAPSSMVKTRFYNKTMELRQVHDKPYIRQAWQAAGLVDDMSTLERTRRDGTVYKPEIWRVEFAVKSGTRKWFVVEDYQGDRKRIISKHNTLDVYYTRSQIFQVFLSLTKHYFHFKVLEYKRTKSTLTTQALAAVSLDRTHPLVEEQREVQRKDRCRDKHLFRYDQLEQFYAVEKLATQDSGKRKPFNSLLTLLYDYRNSQFQTDIVAACNKVIAKLEEDVRVGELSHPFSSEELRVLRQVVAMRLASKGISVDEAFKQVRELLEEEKTIWSIDH